MIILRVIHAAAAPASALIALPPYSPPLAGIAVLPVQRVAAALRSAGLRYLIASSIIARRLPASGLRPGCLDGAGEQLGSSRADQPVRLGGGPAGHLDVDRPGQVR